MSSVDPADEAGGEVVYSDDGLAPAAITKPPAVPQPSTGDEDDDVLDSSEGMNPQLAFEVFQGKIYSAKQQSSKAVFPDKETPLARLARLQQELAEVETQLSVTSAGAGQEFDEQLVQLATTLKTQLTTLQNSSRILEHDDLTRLIRQQLDSLEKKPIDSDAKDSSDTGVVYELYGNATNPTTSSEDRLMKLERAIGSQSSSAGKTLLQRLEEMERLVKTVDATALDQTMTKAKVIRADLEAASKARNKLTATYKKEDSKMIQELHAQLTDLEGLSDHLPALVERLQQLSSLHLQAGTFANRLEALETSANQLSSSVSRAESTMEQLSTNLTQNLTTMEGNLKALDERLNKL